MKLFVKVVDGKVVNHPYNEQNLLEAFPEGIPPEFEPFQRTDTYPGSYGVFEKSAVVYEKNGDFWNDVWSIVPMNEEEKAARIEQISAAVTRHVKEDNLGRAEYNILVAMSLSDLKALQVWSKYADICRAWTLKSVVPTTPRIPTFPTLTPEGVWIEPDDWLG